MAGPRSEVVVPLAAARAGRLPRVSVVSGRPADAHLVVGYETGGLGVGWLLVLLGPPGWLLLALTTSWFRDRVLVALPVTRAERDRLEALDRLRIRAWVGVPIALAGALVFARFPGLVGLGVVIAAVSAVVALTAGWARSWRTPDVAPAADATSLVVRGAHAAFVASLVDSGSSFDPR